MQSKLKWLVFALVWCAVLGFGVLGYKHFWKPVQEKRVEQAKEKEHQKIIENTSSTPHYQNTINLGLDGFTGYCILRSQTFKDECGKKSIAVNIIDDGGDYPKRLKSLADGSLQMSAFTIDALIKASANLGDLPATILLILDETKGADAILGVGKIFPNVDTLNDPQVKVVCTPDSPSEFMTRVVMHHYNLPQFTTNCFQFVNGANEVYNVYKTADPKKKQVYALWEPYVSKMKANPDYHILVDSSKFRGYIVDVLVASRDFVVKNPGVVEDVVKAYWTAVYTRRNDMADLVAEDTRKLGEPVSKKQAESFVQSIWFKNTTENFDQMGLTNGRQLQSIDEMIANITEVLVATKAIKVDPAKGNSSLWYYNEIAGKLFRDGWFPGFGSEKMREECSLAQLSEEEWKSLHVVGTLNVPRLVFSRGTATLTEQSEVILTDLVEKLKTWPSYYLTINGNTVKNDDPEIQKVNLELASTRADAAMAWLVQHGIGQNRIRCEKGETSGSTTVVFIVGQTSY
jgi:NitT/TauT family transport system substrate-binding protein